MAFSKGKIAGMARRKRSSSPGCSRSKSASPSVRQKDRRRSSPSKKEERPGRSASPKTSKDKGEKAKRSKDSKDKDDTDKPTAKKAKKEEKESADKAENPAVAPSATPEVPYYEIGMSVEYLSKSQGGYLKTQIIVVHPDGFVEVKCKPGARLHPNGPDVRPRVSSVPKTEVVSKEDKDADAGAAVAAKEAKAEPVQPSKEKKKTKEVAKEEVPEPKEKKSDKKERKAAAEEQEKRAKEDKKKRKDAASVAAAKIAASFDNGPASKHKPVDASNPNGDLNSEQKNMEALPNPLHKVSKQDGQQTSKPEEPEEDEDEETKLQRFTASLKDMLDERLKEQAEAKDDAQVLELEADIDMVRSLVKEKEEELAKLTSSRKEQALKEENARQEQAMAEEEARVKEEKARQEQAMEEEKARLKQMLLDREKQEQHEAEEREKQRLREEEEMQQQMLKDQEEKERQEALAREQWLLAEKERKEAEIREPHVLERPDRDPPCELPIWCAMPSRQDIKVDVELVRICSTSREVIKRVWFARRSWALFGRRPPANIPEEALEKEPKPDIGLAAARASRSHAALFRNWLGQVFLMDLGSPNGTFVNGIRLQPRQPVEWQVGNIVYFADAAPEYFELRPWKADK